MTALNLWLAPRSAVFLTDAAHLDDNGRMIGVASKVARLPGLSAVASTRSTRQLLDLIACSFGGAFKTFDHMVDELDSAVAVLAEMCGSKVTDFGYEVVLAGWSPKHEEMQAWAGSGGAGSPFASQQVGGYRAPASPEVISSFATTLDQIEIQDGRRLVEAQRQARISPYGGNSFHIVGGYIEETVVTPEGITSRVLARWPDPVGQPISPRA